MKKIFTILVVILFTASVFAQSPEKMSYQAVIRNASNNLVTNTAVGMQISILQGSASGAIVYAETQTPTTNFNGLVNIEIGAGTVVSGNFSTINWTNGTYFIKTETDPTGGTNYTITGTSQLLSVPYALNAKTAETIKNSNNNAVIGSYPSVNYRTDRYNLVVGSHSTDVTKQGGILIVGHDTTDVDNNSPAVPLCVIGTTIGVPYGYGQGFTQGRLISLQRRDNNNPLGALSNRHYIGINEKDKLYIGDEARDIFSVSFDLGRIGIGVSAPKEALHIKSGHIYFESPQYLTNSGIIMKTPDGTKCYTITIDNSGSLITTLIDCPE